MWKCIHGVAPHYLADLCVPLASEEGHQHSIHSSIWCPGSSMCSDIYQPDEFCDTRTDNMEPSASIAANIGHDVMRLQARTEDEPLPVITTLNNTRPSTVDRRQWHCL